MSLISDIFQQNQYFTQNPTAAVRTPRQQAYDELLNKQYDIQQENQKYNTYNNLASGLGGLGKILASAFVKDPMQKAGAMEGITEQEYRTDDLRKAYEQARTNQNKDYVTQAQQQLALARDDEDKAYNRAYQEAKDRLAQQNADRNYGLEVDKFGFAQDRALENLGLDRDKFGLQKNLTDAQIKKLGAETDNLLNPKPLDNKEEQKNIAEQKKDVAQAQAKLKAFEDQIPELEKMNKESNMGGLKKGAYKTINFLSKKSGIGNEGNAFSEALIKDEEKTRTLKQYVLGMMKSIYGGNVTESERDILLEQYGLLGNLSPREFKSSLNSLLNQFRKDVKEKQYSLDLMQNSTQDYQIMEDANGNRAKVYKDGRIEEI